DTPVAAGSARKERSQKAHVLSVRDVKGFPTQLQFVLFAPRHGERFAQTSIHGDESRITEGIALARFTRIGIAEGLIGRGGIAESLRRSRSGTAGRTSSQGLRQRGPRLNLEIGCPACVINRRVERQASVPTEDAGKLPPTDQRVQSPSHASANELSAT